MRKLSVVQSSSRILAAGVLGLSALLACGAASAEVKVAAVKASELILKSPQFKAGQDKMKAEFEKRGKDLEGDAKKFQDDVKKFEKEADMLSADKRAATEKDLRSRQVDLTYKQKQLQEDVQNRDRQLSQEMQEKIKGVITALAKEKGYDLVVQDPVYATDAVDITDEVLKKLGAPAGK